MMIKWILITFGIALLGGAIAIFVGQAREWYDRGVLQLVWKGDVLNAEYELGQ